jgi:hypothetical protein
MGLFDWIRASSQRRECIALIQRYLEITKKHGLFGGSPAVHAAFLVDYVYDQLPPLKGGPYSGPLLGAVVFGTVAADTSGHFDQYGHVYARGLGALVGMAARDVGSMKYAEVSMLAKMEAIWQGFQDAENEAQTSVTPASEPPTLIDLVNQYDHAPDEAQRMAAMMAFMQRMREIDGRP